MQIYPPRHPQLEQALEECYAELGVFLGNDPKIQIAITEGEFVLGNVQVPAEGEVLEEFGATLAELGVSKLVLKEGVRRSELQRFLRILSTEPAELVERGGIEQAIAAAGIVNIEAGEISVGTAHLPDPDVLFRTWEAYSTGLKAVRAIKQRVRAEGTLENAEEIRDFAYRLTDLAMQETRPLLAVHSLKAHDEYSFTHSVNVAMLTLAMAQNLPFSTEDLHEIAVAALLHDVGKECIPLEILNKPGKLTPEEWVVVNRHGLEGARMLSNVEGVGDLAPVVAYEHHLAYHEELRDEATWQPHIASQIVCLGDVYDALRSVRPYRGELPPDEAMRIMEADAGKKFDPILFEGFYLMVGLYPPGTVVRLDSGELAVSYANNPGAPDRPQVLLVRDQEGRPLDEPAAVNLAKDGATHAIAEVVDGEAAGINPVDYL